MYQNLLYEEFSSFVSISETKWTQKIKWKQAHGRQDVFFYPLFLSILNGIHFWSKTEKKIDWNRMHVSIKWIKISIDLFPFEKAKNDDVEDKLEERTCWIKFQEQ